MDGSTTPRVDYGSEEAAMQAYLRDGEKRAATLGNRGPIRFTGSGELHPDILDAYWRCGFYVFEGVRGGGVHNEPAVYDASASPAAPV